MKNGNGESMFNVSRKDHGKLLVITGITRRFSVQHQVILIYLVVTSFTWQLPATSSQPVGECTFFPGDRCLPRPVSWPGRLKATSLGFKH